MEEDDNFERLHTQAREVQPMDLDAAGKILLRASRVGCTGAQTEVLKKALAESTGAGKLAMDAAGKDACNTTEEGVLLRDTEAVADYFIQLIKSEAAAATDDHPIVVCDEGNIYVYCDQDDVETTARAGVYENATDLVMSSIDALSRMPVLNTEAKRKAAFQRVCAKVKHEGFFAEAPPRVPMRNGVLHLTLGTYQPELVDHSPAHRARFRLEHDFDPDAEAPVFDAFLERLFPACAASRQVYLQAAGCALFGARPPQDEARTAVVLVGPPGSGKNTAIAVVEGLMPADAVSHVEPQRWGKETSMATLVGARLNTITELDTSTPLSATLLKRVSSQDPVRARWLYKQEFTFRPRAINLWASNDLPRISGLSSGSGRHDGVERRLVVLETGEGVAAHDRRPDLLEAIRLETPGVINRVVAAFRQLMEQGQFTLPESHDLNIVRIQYGDDPVEIVARLWLEPAPQESVGNQDLMRALRQVATDLGLDSGEAAAPWQMKRLSGQISKLYRARRGDSNNTVTYRGVRIRPSLRERLPPTGAASAVRRLA